MPGHNGSSKAAEEDGAEDDESRAYASNESDEDQGAETPEASAADPDDADSAPTGGADVLLQDVLTVQEDEGSGEL
jgi:hypothetical protein